MDSVKDITAIKDGCYRNGDTVLHILAKHNGNADIIKRFLNGLESFNPQCRIDALDKRNRRGETSYSVARTDGVRKFLWWSEYQDGFYYLATPPVVLVMYSTTGRPYFDREITQLLDVLKSELKVDPILPDPDLSKEEILSEINNIEADRHHQASALIVFYAGHGSAGFVRTKNGFIRIQEFLDAMCRLKTMINKPKVSNITVLVTKELELRNTTCM